MTIFMVRNGVNLDEYIDGALNASHIWEEKSTVTLQLSTLWCFYTTGILEKTGFYSQAMMSLLLILRKID